MSDQTPEAPAHQFHNAAFASTGLEGATGALMEHVVERFMDRRETWTNALVGIAILDTRHGEGDDAQHQTGFRMAGWMGNHTGAWPISWDFGTPQLGDLLDEVAVQRLETESEWNLLVLRMTREAGTKQPVATQVRGFPVPDPMAVLRDEKSMAAMLTGAFPQGSPG